MSDEPQAKATQGDAMQGGAQRGADQPADELYERGMEVRRAVLGDAHVDRAIANTTDFTAPFQEFITRYAWGGVWTREGLDRRTRSVITLSVLTALGREHEIAMHVRAALTNGLTQAEIAEILIHTAVYAGVPTSNAAFAIAQRVFEEG
jgi:4-carboxymuconolactone decarboxylase